MRQDDTKSQFSARLLCPKEPGHGKSWAFVILPKEVSVKLPRRGRTTVDGTINGQEFRALLEPDGQKSHWLCIDSELLEASGTAYGDIAQFEIMPLELEPEPDVPSDLLEALAANPEARTTWDVTTTIARLDWIHWITSAKQANTRKKRINDACDMLASGEKRVCCFDPSGYYSKAFSAPQTLDQ
ncbi:YdeI/OmpD-associated family protein [Herminiimonas arsenitoxidans]|uniref:YdeI/OmpD-associated family protein n=1 Tax=Herminiimonas arsenitoxidans TaxID=1809410 RepID=UPI0009704589|nr:YdeI/OmpD-associated family protein [Herminiimonas arsenitoxidans]